MHSSILIMVTPWHISLPEAERNFPCYGNFLYAPPPACVPLDPFNGKTSVPTMALTLAFHPDPLAGLGALGLHI